MIKLSRRDFSRFTLLAAAGAAVPMSAFAFGGPSGPATIYKKQGAIGELKMNPYKIAPLTAIIRNGGYVIQNASVRIIPKEGGQEIAYKVSNSQLLTHGGIPVFGLYPAYENKVKSNTTVWITDSLSISRKRIRSRHRLSTVPSERRISRRPLSENLLKESSPIGSITSTTSAETTILAMPSGTILKAVRCSGPLIRSTGSLTPKVKFDGLWTAQRSSTSIRFMTAAS